MREGLANCLVEAMLCNCIGVISDIESSNFVIGKTGYKARYGDIEGTSEAIRKALSCSDSERKESRIQALQFSEEKTIDGLKRMIKEQCTDE